MPRRLAKRVLLIGWDAADWRMIRPLLDDGTMPNLHALIERGVSGNIATLTPILSPILWNSIATGKRADKHDILSFVEPDGAGEIRPVSSTSRKAKALWNILSQNDLRSCVLGWFASYPAEPINGVVLSDRFQRTFSDRKESTLDALAVHPPQRIEEFAALQVRPQDLSPEQITPFIPRAARVNQVLDRRIAALAKLLAECATIHNGATHLIENETWDFMAIYYDAIDHFGHAFMEYHPPKMPHIGDDEFEIYQHVMNACYRFHDMMLGRTLQLAGPDTTVILLSDHGFENGPLRPALAADPVNPKKKVGPGVNPVAWHRQYGVFVAAGPTIKKDELVHGASLLDVAPTILTLLGLPVARDMDGNVLTQIFTETVEIERIDSYEPPHPNDGVHRGEVAQDPFAAQEAMQQLIDLGYIDPMGPDKQKTIANLVAGRKSNLAQVYFAAGKPEKTLALLRELRQANDEEALRLREVMCLITMRRFDEAETILNDPAMNLMKLSAGRIALAELKFFRKDFLGAHDLLDSVRQQDIPGPQIHILLGQVELARKRWPEAERAFRRALAIDPDNAEAHDGLGLAFHATGKLEEAAREHMRSAALLHARPATHIHLGNVLAKLGQIDWAIRAFEVALELSPDMAYPHARLAVLHRRARRDFKRAMEHYRKASELAREKVRRKEV